MNSDKTQQTNHLINENSPYLLSHAHNPVDWYPWGDEALAKAKGEDKPIFLSIGYAACHWCHVMARESFESEKMAELLNRDFVSIKVDREQRPDLDQIYMNFTTAMTGSGGWPMSVFLTPDLKPFFAGTYFPPVPSHGRPSFERVLTEIAAAWKSERQTLVESAENIFGQISNYLAADSHEGAIPPNRLSQAAEQLMQSYDNVYGGFGQAPKFPHGLDISLLLRQSRHSGDLSFMRAATHSLTAMARGGIYDQIGGGFARYSTDRHWLVPHFEKMLYDNALLVPVYAEGWQVTKDDEYLRVIRETLDWIGREMTSKDGAFYSALDADSEGEEGKFYLWDKSEIHQVLDTRTADLFCRYYGVADEGNWDGHNILHKSPDSDRLEKEMEPTDLLQILSEARTKLLSKREERVRPATDDKVLTSWNGLAVSALCRGFQVAGDRRYVEAAIKNAEFITQTLLADGKLTHSFRDGRHSDGEFLEDYAYYIGGLIDLFETDLSGLNERWLTLACDLADAAVELFQDNEGRWYLRPEDQGDLIMRPRDETDSSLPAPGSIMITNLLRLHRLTGRDEYLRSAEKALSALAKLLEQFPSGMASAVLALDFYVSDKIEIVVVGNGVKQRAMLNEVHTRFIPNRIIAVSNDGDSDLPLFEGRQPGDGTVAYVCRQNTCKQPADTSDELVEQLSGL